MSEQNLLEKPFTQLRIFLSYGHDENERLVVRIKEDLKTRGHDVWFDKTAIKFGDNWRREITDGIVGSDNVLSFLSKHSTRDPGGCLDEIAIAIGVKGGNIQTILVESEADVKPPPSISHKQWLDMHDWKEKEAAGTAVWMEWYQGKFAEIIRVVESDESCRFAGEIEMLSGYLKPISPDSRISALLRKGFVGRTWLFEAVEQWRTAKGRDSHLLWIVGKPGVGKSAFAAHLTHFGRDKVIAAQFVEWDKPDHKNAQRVIRSIAFQLAARLPDYRKLLLTLPEIADLDKKNASELFDYLITNPLSIAIPSERERHLIIIDGLDEASEAGCNPLVDMLARNASRLPEWLGFVVTSRPEYAVEIPLQELKPVLLDTRIEDNLRDIREYLHLKLANVLGDRSDTDSLIEQVLEKSEGVFLYVEHVCRDLQQGLISLDNLDQLPLGLGGIFFQFFQRQFPDLEIFRKQVRPALRSILAAREPLPVEIFQGLFGMPDEDLRDFTRTLGSLFPTYKESGIEVIKPYHKSLEDWLTDESKAGVYYISTKEGHKLLAEYGQNRIQVLPEVLRDAEIYWIRNLIYHCCKSAKWDTLVQFIDNPKIYEKLVLVYDELGWWNALTICGEYYDNFVSQIVASLPIDLRQKICCSLARAFAERARDNIRKISAMAKKHNRAWNFIRNYLAKNNPVELLQITNAAYSFVMTAALTGEFATAAVTANPIPVENVALFLSQYGDVQGLFWFLSNFATTEGWSGWFEDEGSGLYKPWTKLIKLSQGETS